MAEKELDLARLADAAERLEERLTAVERALAARRLRSEAEGGRVAATADGNIDLVAVHIDPSLLARGPAALANLLRGVIGEALDAARRASASTWDSAALTLSLPGILFPEKHPPRYPELGPRLPFVWGFRFKADDFRRRTFPGTAGPVRVTVSGELRLTGLDLDPRATLPTADELERLVRTAVDQALARAKTFARQRPGDLLDVAFARS